MAEEELGELAAAGEVDSHQHSECLLSARKLCLSVGKTLVLHSASLVLLTGRCYGLIGPNGAGKTTLLRWLRSHLCSHRSDLHVRYVGQTDAELEQAPHGQSVLEYVVAGHPGRAARERELALLEGQPVLSADDAVRLGKLLVMMEEDDTEERGREALTALGFCELGALVATLSGGWRGRLELARAIVSQPDVLLLDEPTNHLDLEAVLILGGLIRDLTAFACVIVVSHDSAFLDYVSTDIACVNKQTVQQVPGDYANFEEKAHQYRSYHEQLWDKRGGAEEKLVRSVEQQKARARRAGDEKALKNAGARLRKVDRVGMYREDGKKFKLFSLSKMSVESSRLPLHAEPVRMDGRLTFRLPEECDLSEGGGSGVSSSATLVTLSGVVVGYNDKPVLSVGDEVVQSGDRIALMGVNGSGKTTMLRAILGVNGVMSGTIHRGCTRIGMVDQHVLASLSVHVNDTPLELLQARFPSIFKTETDTRRHLGRFGLGGAAALTPIGDLSGGLRVRLILADVFAQPPDLLLLDEPTNHLDGESIIALGNALRRYSGAVMAVSHNLAFLLDIFRDLWVCKDGNVTAFRGCNREGNTLADHVERYALPVVRPEDKQVFKSMLRTRAARSAIVAQQPSHMTTLIV